MQTYSVCILEVNTGTLPQKDITGKVSGGVGGDKIHCVGLIISSNGKITTEKKHIIIERL